MTSRLLKDRYPEVFAQLHPTKNEGVSVEKLTYGSRKILWWICSKNHEWITSPCSRKGKNRRGEDVIRSCPYCCNQKVCEDNCLANNDPYNLCEEWDYEKNCPITPHDIVFRTNKKYWWKCLSKNHIWDCPVSSRITTDKTGTKRRSYCPYCVGQRVCEDNCLANNDPKNLCSQWNYEKNHPLTPHDVTPSSTKLVWWKCEKGHEFKRKISNRFNGGCRICGIQIRAEKNRRVRKNNSLGTKFPYLLRMWDYKKNRDINPFKINYGTKLCVWWRCLENHEWKNRVTTMTSRLKGCPVCQEPKGERAVRLFLENNNLKHDHQKTFNDCRHTNVLRFDFYVYHSTSNFIIEYDGIQHFKVVKRFGGAKGFRDRIIKDHIKNEWCDQNNIPLLRISYTQLRKVDTIVKEFIEKL